LFLPFFCSSANHFRPLFAHIHIVVNVVVVNDFTKLYSH